MMAMKSEAREEPTPRRLRRVMERLEWARARRMAAAWGSGGIKVF
jgi:hypothetical protein